jgi:prepilin-type N-terminal cleavage/methylation domain-containing protein
MRRARSARLGFTLAEVAVTIAIVGIALVLVLQGLNSAKLTAASSRNVKLARELALLTLGRIESGEYWEEMDDGRIEGTYADDGYPMFSFEAVLGEESFLVRPEDEQAGTFDNWRKIEDQKTDEEKKKEEEAEQPYERVQIKVLYPKIQDLKNELVLEKWVPWRQAHPPEETDTAGSSGSNSSNSSNASNGTSGVGGNTASGGSKP